MQLVLGILGGVLGFSGNSIYFINVLKGKTKPQRVTWGIAFLLNIIFVCNQVASGATYSMILVFAFSLSAAAIFFLSIPKGVGGHSRLDLFVLACSLVGVVLWQLLNSPLASILANLFAAAISLIPTLKKAYLQPETETKIKWLLGSLAGLLGALSVGNLNYTVLLFPLFAFVAQGSVFIVLTQKAHKR